MVVDLGQTQTTDGKCKILVLFLIMSQLCGHSKKNEKSFIFPTFFPDFFKFFFDQKK